MPKVREATLRTNCSFCGEHKDDVPLMVTSQMDDKPAICCICALGVVQQTFFYMGEVDKKFRRMEAQMRKPPPRPQIETESDVGRAVDEVQGGNKVNGRER